MGSTAGVIQKRDWVSVAAFAYLAIPLLIFVITHLKNWLGIPLSLLFTFITIKVVRFYYRQRLDLTLSRPDIAISLFLLVFWVFLSGVGGYAFQNSDHDTRNSILRDLIQNRWPVTYQQNNATYGLVYYIGFWLPSALLGKWLGWETANFALFIWTLIGVALSVLLLKKRLITSMLFCTMLLIFFSGMDFLGVILIKLLGVHGYPFLWPPISHLEWWAGLFQFSSTTTQLFWVFNQAIPCWVIMALMINQTNNKHLLFLWGLALFYCPLPALGMAPYIILLVIYQSNTSIDSPWISKKRKVWYSILHGLKRIFSVENLLGGIPLLLLGVIYYLSNKVTGNISLLKLDLPILFLYLLFITFEVFILILLVVSSQKNRPWIIITSILLALSPLFIIGNNKDFTMRVSIPALFVLLFLTGEELLHCSKQRIREFFIISVLLLGSLTPLYEISRSIYRTFMSYQEPIITVILTDPPTKKFVTFPPNYPTPEFAHPNSITANSYKSLTYFDLDTAINYVTRTETSYFYKWIAK